MGYFKEVASEYTLGIVVLDNFYWNKSAYIPLKGVVLRQNDEGGVKRARKGGDSSGAPIRENKLRKQHSA